MAGLNINIDGEFLHPYAFVMSVPHVKYTHIYCVLDNKSITMNYLNGYSVSFAKIITKNVKSDSSGRLKINKSQYRNGQLRDDYV